VDQQDFVKPLTEACEKTGFEIHAYCLMRHHFHLVVETPHGNLAARLRRETTITLRWIAARLPVGSWKSLAAKFHRRRKTHNFHYNASRLEFDP
jgi:REP element-mobilizing transposase RayT